MSNLTYTARERIRFNGRLYKPRDRFPGDKLPAATRQRFLDEGKLTAAEEQAPPPKSKKKKDPPPPPPPSNETGSGDGETSGQDPAGDDPGGQSAQEHSKEFLMGKNKAYTEQLCEQAGLPKEEWGSLNKEPLIDFYLQSTGKNE